MFTRLRSAIPSADTVFFVAVLALFFVSGASGLLYQVVWTRKLVLLLGAASYAVSTVLTVFFLGLGLGSLWGGRLARTVRSPLKVYGLLEIAIGLWAALFLVLANMGESQVVALLQFTQASRTVAVILRAVCAVAFLLAPVLLMGATLPLLSAACSRTGLAARRIGLLYGINTSGAFAGCMVTGFMLISTFGYARATLMGAALNIVAGLLAILLSRLTFAEPEDVAPESAEVNPTPFSQYHWVFAMFALSGFCALACEVVWTRLLVLVFLGTTYAFTTMLAAILAGIAIGGLAGAAIARRMRRPQIVLGLVELCVGAATLATIVWLADLPAAYQQCQIDAGHKWEQLLQVKFFLSFGILFAPTFLMGLAFPIVVRCVDGSPRQVAQRVGRLYAGNTFGGVLGAALGGFVLLPWLGAHKTLLLLGILMAAGGLLLVVTAPGSSVMRRAGYAMLGLIACAVAFARLPQDVGLAMNKAYVPADHKVIHYREGVEGTVAVTAPKDREDGADRVLWVNAVQATASIERGVRMNRFQGILPFLFDRRPARALFMCFGSGITAGTLASAGIETVDAVEISPDVLKAAPCFGHDNLDVLNNSRIRFHIDDGRNFLLTSPDQYDLITFEPMPLALAGVSTFYTHEFYVSCRRHLAPGGLVSQWVPLHSLDPEVVRALIRTFLEVFPDTCAWFINADMFLIGSDGPVAIDYDNARTCMARPELAAALKEAGLDDINEVLSCYAMGAKNLHDLAYAGEARYPVLRDDLPWAEFVAPRLMYLQTVQDSLKDFIPFFESPTTVLTFSRSAPAQQAEFTAALDRRSRARITGLDGLRQYYGGMIGSNPDIPFKKALDIDPNDQTAQYYVREIALTQAKAFLRWGDREKAVNQLEDALRYLPEQPALLGLLAEARK